MAVIGYATVQLVPSFEGLEGKLNTGLTGPIEKVSDDSGKKSGGIWGNGFITTVGHVMVAAGLYQIGQSIATGIGNGIVTGLKTASFMQEAQISLTTLLGSGTAAQSMLAQLSKFAAATPFNLQGVVTGTQQLLGAGSAAKDVIPTLTALGDTEGALGGTQDDLNHTLTAWTQLQTRGKIDTQDLLQISNQGIPIWKELAKAVDVPVSSIQDLVSTGTLTSDVVLPKLRAQLEKDYGGSMAKQAQTLAGVWSTVQDTITQALGKAFEPLAPMLAKTLPGAAALAAKGIAVLGTTVIPAAGRAIAGLVAWLQTTSDWYIQNSSWINPLAAAIGKVALAFVAWGVSAKLVALGIKLITGAFTAGPWGLILTIVSGIGVAFLSTKTGAKQFSDFLAAFPAIFTKVENAIKPMIATTLPAFKKLWQEIQPDIASISKALGSALLTALQQLPGLIKALTPLLDQLAKVLGRDVPLLTKFASAALNILAPALTSLTKQASSSGKFWSQTFHGDFVGAFQTAYTALTGPNGLGGLKDYVQSAMHSIQTILIAAHEFLTAVFSGDWSTAWQMIQNIVRHCFSGIESDINGALRWFATLSKPFRNAITGAFRGAESWLVGVGVNIVQGLINGVESMATRLVNSIIDLIPAPIRGAVEKALGINSPSRVFAQIGQYVVQGFINGVTDGKDDVAKAYGVFGAPSVYGPQVSAPANGGLTAAMTSAPSAGLTPIQVDSAGILSLIQQAADGRIALFAKRGAQRYSAGSLHPL